MLLISFAIIFLSHCANLCSKFWLLLVYILIWYMGLEFSVFFSICVSEFLRMSELWIVYLIILCFYVAITCVCFCLEGIF